jgi:Ca2+-binding EF-hand superfamily protein
MKSRMYTAEELAEVNFRDVKPVSKENDHEITVKNVDEILTRFTAADDDGNGELDREEFTTAFGDLFPDEVDTPETAHAMYAAVDADGSDSVSKAEFVSFLVGKHPERYVEQESLMKVTAEFDAIDTDGRGSIATGLFIRLYPDAVAIKEAFGATIRFVEFMKFKVARYVKAEFGELEYKHVRQESLRPASRQQLQHKSKVSLHSSSGGGANKYGKTKGDNSNVSRRKPPNLSRSPSLTQHARKRIVSSRKSTFERDDEKQLHYMKNDMSRIGMQKRSPDSPQRAKGDAKPWQKSHAYSPHSFDPEGKKQQQQQQQQQETARGRSNSERKQMAKTDCVDAEALFTFKADDDEGLSFKKGDVLNIVLPIAGTNKEGLWLEATTTAGEKKSGLVPSNYFDLDQVGSITPAPVN